MSSQPTFEELKNALVAASAAHHEYEMNALNGKFDEQWPGWYAAYVLGRLGDFSSPSNLSSWLENVPGEGDWTVNAANNIFSQIGIS